MESNAGYMDASFVTLCFFVYLVYIMIKLIFKMYLFKE